jgi:hypothetical protein
MTGPGSGREGRERGWGWHRLGARGGLGARSGWGPHVAACAFGSGTGTCRAGLVEDKRAHSQLALELVMGLGGLRRQLLSEMRVAEAELALQRLRAV